MTSKIAKKYQNAPPNIWVAINEIVAREKPLNLGQGFPDYHTRPRFSEHLAEIHKEGNALLHQYTRSFGHVRLVNALAALYKPDFGGRQLDPLNEIVVSIGAYGSLFTALSALLNPGDEAIVIEPFFDCYVNMVKNFGAVPKTLPLRLRKDVQSPLSSSAFYLDMDELEALASPKTKLLILNTPNNPCGKVMQREELQQVAEFCKRHDIICVSDEVYEFLVYEPNTHIKIASLPGMWERTLTVGSAGKTLSMTGWKLGWTVGPAELLRGMRAVHQDMVYTCPTPLQEAVARSLEEEVQLREDDPQNTYWAELRRDLLEKRNLIAEELSKVGLHPIIPEGGYFILADISNFNFPVEKEEDSQKSECRDAQFNKWMIKNKKLAAIPNSSFYTKNFAEIGEKYVRFCFIKSDETLKKAFEIFRNWNN